MTLLWEPQISQLQSKYDSTILTFEDVKRWYKNKLVKFPKNKPVGIYKFAQRIKHWRFKSSRMWCCNIKECAVPIISKDCNAFISNPSNCSELCTKQCSVTLQRTWIFNHITVRTSHLPSNHRHNTQEQTTNAKYRDENSIKVTAKIRSE